MKVVKVEMIPTGIECKDGMYVKILNRYIQIEITKHNRKFPNFEFFNITIPSKTSKTFDYFIDLYKKEKKVKSMVAYIIASWMGGKFTAGYEGTIYGITVIGFEGDKVKLRCDNFDSV